MGHEEFMSQEEVDALLKGVTGESDSEAEQTDRVGVRPYNIATQERIVRGKNRGAGASAGVASAEGAGNGACLDMKNHTPAPAAPAATIAMRAIRMMRFQGPGEAGAAC